MKQTQGIRDRFRSGANHQHFRHRADVPANTPMQLTPLRVPKILAFLKVRIGLNVIPIYEWRRS